MSNLRRDRERPLATLDGPSRTIRVEPIELPAPAPREQPEPQPERDTPAEPVLPAR